MPADCLLSVLAVAFEIACWISLPIARFSRDRRTATTASALLVGSVCGLGFIILIAALFQLGCALPAGLTFSLLLLAIIGSTGSDLAVDPYTLIYPPDSKTTR